MNQQSNLFFNVIVLLLVTSLKLTLSKPTNSDGTGETNRTESSGLLKASANEIIPTNVGESKISSEYSDYRKDYAAQMLSYMNHSVHPCDDFYEYACGNWKNVIEEHISITKRNNFLDIAYKLNNIVENILQRPDINDLAPEYAAEFELAKKFYYNCLAAELYPKRASPEYLTFLKEIGGFPAVDADWNSENFDWLNMSAHLSNYNIRSFINEDIITEYPYPPYFKIPNFGFDIELHGDTINNASSNAYIANEKNMRDILTVYGVEENRIDTIVSEIFQFLKKILKILEGFNESRHNCNTLSKTMNESDIMPIKEKLHTYYDIAWMGNTFEDVEGCETHCIPCLYLYEKLDKICEENKQTAANYLALKFLFHIDDRNKDKRHQRDACISNVKSSMIYFFDHLYMKLHFSDKLREEIIDISKKIRQSLRLILQNANWLDETTREAALLKESKITEHIGRYEDPTVTRLLIGEMKKLQFTNGSYEANILNLRKFKQYMVRFNGLNFEKLSNTTRPLKLLVGMQPDCFYYNLDNAIYLMAGVLTTPVYNRAWPNSLKFGALGYVIGHEFTHGFDADGAHYDEDGNQNQWWSNKSTGVFKDRCNCYVDHFQKYLIPEINRKINGELTRDENIADSGGLHEALMAYRYYLKDVAKDFDSTSQLYKNEQMPGIDLSPEQLFFLGFAQLWCASYTEGHYWQELTNEHAIDKYRVLGALSNNENFARAYNCTVGSKMNPSSDKCKMW